jgi:hypothetical protein
MEYNVKVDEKGTIWFKYILSVTADSLEEAQEIVKKDLKSGRIPDSVVDTEYLFDTYESMIPEENDGWGTLEIVDEDGETIWSNGKY